LRAVQLAQSGRTIEKNLGKIDLGADEQLETEVDPLFRQMSGVWRMLGGRCAHVLCN
jgi:hypothetical protein